MPRFRVQVRNAEVTSAPAAAESGRLSTPRLFGFAGLGIPAGMLALVLGIYLPRFYAAHLNMSLIAVGGAISLVRLIDIAFDPFLGIGMDRTRTFIGRYRPWLLAGAPLVMVSIWQLLMPPPNVGPAHLITWMLVLSAGSSMFALGQAAWAAGLASGYNDRSRVYGWMQSIPVAAAVLVLLLPVLTHGALDPTTGPGMMRTGWMLILVYPVFYAIGLTVTPDRATSAAAGAGFNLQDFLMAVRRPDMVRLILADLFLTLGPGMTGPIYLFFFHDAKGFPFAQAGTLLIFYIGAALLGAPFWARVAQRFGKHRTVQIAGVSYAVTQTILMALPAAAYLPTAIGMFAVGFCASAFALAIRAMVADLADQVRLEQNRDLTSMLYAMVTTTTKIGTTITTAISFTVLAMVVYQASEHAQNNEQAIFGLKMVYLFAPIILVFFGGAMFFGYKLDATRHEEIRNALNARDFGSAEESLLGLSPAAEDDEIALPDDDAPAPAR